MKSPFLKSTVALNPAFSVYFLALANWKSLLLTPVILASVKLAIWRAGPPTPQPTSRTFIPALIPIWAAR